MAYGVARGQWGLVSPGSLLFLPFLPVMSLTAEMLWEVGGAP